MKILIKLSAITVDTQQLTIIVRRNLKLKLFYFEDGRIFPQMET